jgi:hypothetical protein
MKRATLRESKRFAALPDLPSSKPAIGKTMAGRWGAAGL